MSGNPVRSEAPSNSTIQRLDSESQESEIPPLILPLSGTVGDILSLLFAHLPWLLGVTVFKEANSNQCVNIINSNEDSQDIQSDTVTATLIQKRMIDELLLGRETKTYQSMSQYQNTDDHHNVNEQDQTCYQTNITDDNTQIIHGQSGNSLGLDFIKIIGYNNVLLNDLINESNNKQQNQVTLTIHAFNKQAWDLTKETYQQTLAKLTLDHSYEATRTIVTGATVANSYQNLSQNLASMSITQRLRQVQELGSQSSQLQQQPSLQISSSGSSGSSSSATPTQQNFQRSLNTNLNDYRRKSDTDYHQTQTQSQNNCINLGLFENHPWTNKMKLYINYLDNVFWALEEVGSNPGLFRLPSETKERKNLKSESSQTTQTVVDIDNVGKFGMGIGEQESTVLESDSPSSPTPSSEDSVYELEFQMNHKLVSLNQQQDHIESQSESQTQTMSFPIFLLPNTPKPDGFDQFIQRLINLSQMTAFPNLYVGNDNFIIDNNQSNFNRLNNLNDFALASLLSGSNGRERLIRELARIIGMGIDNNRFNLSDSSPSCDSDSDNLIKLKSTIDAQIYAFRQLVPRNGGNGKGEMSNRRNSDTEVYSKLRVWHCQ